MSSTAHSREWGDSRARPMRVTLYANDGTLVRSWKAPRDHIYFRDHMVNIDNGAGSKTTIFVYAGSVVMEPAD